MQRSEAMCSNTSDHIQYEFHFWSVNYEAGVSGRTDDPAAVVRYFTGDAG